MSTDLDKRRVEILEECERRRTERVMVYLLVYETKKAKNGTLYRNMQANLPKAGKTGKFIQIRWTLWGSDTKSVGDYLQKYLNPRKKYTIEFDPSDLTPRTFHDDQGVERVAWELGQPPAIYLDIVSIIKATVVEAEAQEQSPANDEQELCLDYAF